MSNKIYKAQIKFRYIPELNQTHLLVKFPGESWYTKVASRNGMITKEDALTFVQRVSSDMALQGYNVVIDDKTT